MPEERRHHGDPDRHDDTVINRIFQRIDELGTRVDHAVGQVDSVSKALIAHMRYEDERYLHIDKGIDEIRTSLHGIIDSMPRDETGKPSLFVHRQDHELAKEYKSTAREDRRALRNKAIDLAVLAAVIFLATHAETILKFLTH